MIQELGVAIIIGFSVVFLWMKFFKKQEKSCDKCSVKDVEKNK